METVAVLKPETDGNTLLDYFHNATVDVTGYSNGSNYTPPELTLFCEALRDGGRAPFAVDRSSINMLRNAIAKQDWLLMGAKRFREDLSPSLRTSGIQSRMDALGTETTRAINLERAAARHKRVYAFMEAIDRKERLRYELRHEAGSSRRDETPLYIKDVAGVERLEAGPFKGPPWVYVLVSPAQTTRIETHTLWTRYKELNIVAKTPDKPFWGDFKDDALRFRRNAEKITEIVEKSYGETDEGQSFLFRATEAREGFAAAQRRMAQRQ